MGYWPGPFQAKQIGRAIGGGGNVAKGSGWIETGVSRAPAGSTFPGTLTPPTVRTLLLPRPLVIVPPLSVHEFAPVQFDWIMPPRLEPLGTMMLPVPPVVRQGPVCFSSTIAKALLPGEAPPTPCARTGFTADTAGIRNVRTCLTMTTSTYLPLPANAAPALGGWVTSTRGLFTLWVKPFRVRRSGAAWL